MWRVFASLALLSLSSSCRSSDASESEVTIAAAASMRGSMPDLVRRFETKHPTVRVSVTYGASGDLKKQVEGGAPIDGVVFAARAPVTKLVEDELVDAASVKVIAHNALVLVGPKGKPGLTFSTLDALPEGEKLAIGEPGAVPAGQYAKTALENLGLWDKLKGKVVYGGDVGAVLAYARRGEVAAAIVYSTEARGIEDIVVLDTAKGEWAPRPEVVSGVVRVGKHAALASDFLGFLSGEEGQSTLASYGFAP